jgi:hypothetical protein
VRHGLSKTPEYKAYIAAKDRCTNPKSQYYTIYGGRGIQFKFKDFIDFIQHIKPRPSSAHSLDRKNNDGHYEVGNVRWATLTEQRNNRRPQARKRLENTKGCTRRTDLTKSKTWQAQIGIKGKTTFIGYFRTEEEAINAYKEEREKLERK